MTRVSPVTKRPDSLAPGGRRSGHQDRASRRPAARPGSPRGTCRRRAVGGASVLAVSVTISGRILVDQ